MNIYQFFIIAIMKLIAIQIILGGIFLQIRAGASLAPIMITSGSLLFAIAGNTLLAVILINRPRK